VTPRYGILVQMAQLLAQLFLDWCVARDRITEPFSLLVPRDVLSDAPDNDVGYQVTITPVKKKAAK
jgi:hypothetical protein